MPAWQYVYVMKDLTKSYPGGREVFKGITLSFLPDVKIGVLGPNGAGKSTLMRIMAGQDKEFGGEAWAAEGARVGYLPQEPHLDETKTVGENVMEAFAELLGQLAASTRSPTNSPRNDGGADERPARRAGRAAGEDRGRGGLGARPAHRDRARRAALPALRQPRHAPLGGERRRVALCKLLLESPTCCCSTSRRTTWTPRASPGSRRR
jgi:ATPase subunit of ABC transporter with duplicated ATPase domains